MPSTTREELEREYRERAEPFCDCYQRRTNKQRKHLDYCCALKVYSAMLKMAAFTT